MENRLIHTVGIGYDCIMIASSFFALYFRVTVNMAIQYYALIKTIKDRTVHPHIGMWYRTE